MNYYDILLAKKLEDDRDPKVEGLSVTANGTYSEEGKVYKPVIVNVAGYGLADMPGGAIASFSDGAALPLNKLKVSIDPVQSGSGNPSPTNIRPISGWTEAKVVVSPTTDTEDGTTYTVQFTDGTNPLVVYGGTLDVINGVLTVDRVIFDLGSINWNSNTYGINNIRIFYRQLYPATDFDAVVGGYDVVCDSYKTDRSITLNNFLNNNDNTIGFGNSVFNNGGTITINDSQYQYYSTAEFKQAVNGIKAIIPLATPITYQLTPTSIKAIEGVNNIFADTGNILEGQYFKSL